MNRNRALFFRIGTPLVVVFGLLACLGICEAFVRLFLPRPEDDMLADYASRALDMLDECGATDELGRPDKDALRLAVVGESSGVRLTRALRSEGNRVAPRALRLAGCAQEASSVEQIRRRFLEVAEARPDAVVVEVGHNLSLYYPTDPTAVWTLWLRTRSSLFMRLAPAGAHPQLDNGVRQTVLERFLREAARLSRERGFRLLMTTMVANHWVPTSTPDSEQWRHATSVAGPWDELLRARYLKYSGRGEEALALLTELAQHNVSPDVWLELAIWRRQEGLLAEARAALDRAQVLAPMGRASRETNELIRRVAAEEGLLLLDADALAERAAGDGMPGWESVIDNCHLSDAGFAAQGVAVLRLLGVETPAQEHPLMQEEDYLRQFAELVAHRDSGIRSFLGDRETDVAMSLAFWRLLAIEGPRAAKPLRELDARLADTPEPPAVRQRLLTAVARALFLAGDLDAAELVARAALTLQGPAAAAAWTEVALIQLRRQRPSEAESALREALRQDPAWTEAQVYLRLIQHPR